MRDAVVGIYAGEKGFDFSAYESFPAFVEAGNGGMVQLAGNPRNDKYFHA